ncbi:uncharacterized protein PAC_06759 [Phialocephala subalpina]|uniref:2EXR domain-containing protein n=1 Tax=Phialocephala subalpina TaxID=576137 RepID=A0A1L7WVQ3_9HELO|nr:uncharacterized protein PAC_06759 [Phialocephala subalpina]
MQFYERILKKHLAEIANNLTCASSESFPDPNLELYIQFLDALTLFPKLSIELRLRVWRLCFPEPREVYIGRRFIKRSVSNNRPQRYSKDHANSLPPTLHINAESRQETLRSYTLIWRKDLGEETKDWRHPICFDTKRCLPYFQYYDALFSPTLWWSWIKELDLRSGNLITENVRRLEVKQLHKSVPLMDFIRGALLGIDVRTPYGYDLESPIPGGLFLLTILQRVTFTLWIDDDDPAQLSIEEHQSAIAAYLNMHKDSLKGGKVQEVYNYPPDGME